MSTPSCASSRGPRNEYATFDGCLLRGVQVIAPPEGMVGDFLLRGCTLDHCDLVNVGSDMLPGSMIMNTGISGVMR
jgi:hypothetical protein